MAKRKRLTAPDPERLAVPQERHAMPMSDIPTGIIPTPRRAPIADVAGQASAVAALEKVAAEMQAARSEGRMAIKIALEDIAGNYLSRDRVALDEAEMEVLTASLRSRGQQTPIEVVEIEGGKYGLISGFRRVQALRAMATEGGALTNFPASGMTSPSQSSIGRKVSDHQRHRYRYGAATDRSVRGRAGRGAVRRCAD